MSTNTSPVKVEHSIRDTIQSLFAGLISAAEAIAAERNASKVGYSGHQVGGGFLPLGALQQGRDPWDELKKMCQENPEMLKSILVRGSTLVGFEEYPDDVIEAFMEICAEVGVDATTIFNGFNDITKMTAPIKAAKANGLHARGAICIGDNQSYDMAHYKKFTAEIVEAGADSFYLKDPVGSSDPDMVYELVSYLKAEYPDMEVHIHTHDTYDTALKIYIAAIEAGVDTVDAAHPAFSGNTAQISILKLHDAIKNHPNPNVRARLFELNFDALAADVKSFNELRARYHEYEIPYDEELLEAMYTAKAAGGATATLVYMKDTMSNLLDLNWHDTQIAIYRVQAKLLPFIGDMLQVTPQAKNTTEQAAMILFNEALNNQEFKGKISQLKTGEDSAKAILDFISATANDSFVKQALLSNMTPAMSKTLSENAQIMPGTVDPDVLEYAQKIVLKSDKSELSMLNAQQALENAEIDTDETLFVKKDVLTAAIFGDKGAEHVKNKLEGTLIEEPKPIPYHVQNNVKLQSEPDNWMDNKKNKEPTQIRIRKEFNKTYQENIFDIIGGAAAIEGIAQNAFTLIKRKDYRPDVNSDKINGRADNAYYSELNNYWHEKAAKEIEAYKQSIPQLLKDAGYEGKKLNSAITTVNELLQEACSHKGVPNDLYPNIEKEVTQVIKIKPQDQLTIA